MADAAELVAHHAVLAGAIRLDRHHQLVAGVHLHVDVGGLERETVLPVERGEVQPVSGRSISEAICGAAYFRGVPADDGSYFVEHTASIMLVDPRGRLVALFAMPHDAATIADRFLDLERAVLAPG